MSKRFDPYHKWLGIPPAEQPPNHYRLLGISLFESDPDVITYAADQRMAHVRTFQAGAHSEASQQILNEIAGARVTLLNPERKTAYDEGLRRALAVPPAEPLAAMPAPPPPPLPVAGEVAGVPPIQVFGPTVGASTGGVRHAAGGRRKSNSRDMLVAVAVVLLLGGGVVGAVLSGLLPLNAPLQGPPNKTVETEVIEDEPEPEADAGSAADRDVQSHKRVIRRRTVRVHPSGPNTLGDLMETTPDPTPQPAKAAPETKPPQGPRDLSDLVNAPGGPGASGGSQITLPSGKVLAERMFPKDAVFHQGKHSVATLHKTSDVPFTASISHDNGVLNGTAAARYDNGQPMLFATYAEGKRDGILQYWNPQGQKVLWGECAKGKNHGLGCLFRDDQPHLVLEYSADRIEAVHLIADGKIQKTCDEAQALEDAAVKALIAEFDEFGRQVKRTESEFRDAAKAEAEKVRQEIAAKLSVKKREAIQSRINKRAQEREEAMRRAVRGGR